MPGGRPRKDDEHKRSIQRNIRLNHEEDAIICAKASEAGKPPVDYMRAAAIGAILRAVPQHEQLIKFNEAIGSLRRLGNLMKMNMKELPKTPDSVGVLELLKTTAVKVSDAADEIRRYVGGW